MTMVEARRDPAMIHSNFERRPGDKYWTEPWVTKALLHVFGDYLTGVGGVVWEPACGRGDMSNVLSDYGLDVWSSDVDTSDFDESSSRWAEQRDFLGIDSLLDPPEDVRAIVTNPPYGSRAVRFLRRALEHDVEFVAMLLRSEFMSGSGRNDPGGSRRALFERDDCACEVKLSPRPRWDEWREKPKPDDGPRHNYSWLVWNRDMALDHPYILFARKEDLLCPA